MAGPAAQVIGNRLEGDLAAHHAWLQALGALNAPDPPIWSPRVPPGGGPTAAQKHVFCARLPAFGISVILTG
jgi:hypothetical protein